ncbi:hypothetical protein ACRRTK_013807 [Alexandromys fortis]
MVISLMVTAVVSELDGLSSNQQQLVRAGIIMDKELFIKKLDQWIEQLNELSPRSRA